jgi:membrane fusion protein, multidrug efflux system
MRILRPILLIAVPCLAVAGALLWWLWGGRYISTENAYVKADIVHVSSEVAGRVIEVAVKDHALVKPGDLLLKIDPEPYKLALEKAEAELDQTRARVAALRAEYAESMAEITEAQDRVQFFEAQRSRQQRLVDKGVGRAFVFEEADSNADAARARVTVARQKNLRVLAQLAGDPKVATEAHPLVREKMAARDRAKLDLDRTVLTAPLGGLAVNVKLLPGEHVRVATPLFALVSDGSAWVEANFKETELTYVRPGHEATVVLDIYPDVTWKARVESISPATGAEFALLPPQNASGNWVKVVQRLPVRLKLKPADSSEPLPLRAGMTATVTVDTQRERRISSLFGGRSVAATVKP